MSWWCLQMCERVKVGFADPPTPHVSWHAINSDLDAESFVRKHGEKDSVTSHHEGAAGEHPPTPTSRFLTCSLPPVLFHSVALPLIISSPSHTPPSSSSSLYPPVFYLPPTFGALFCQQAHLIKAESRSSALPWERRSLGEIKCLSRKNLDQSWLKLCKLSQTNL